MHLPGANRKEVTQDCPTFLLQCLPSFLLREGFNRPFPLSTVKSTLWTHELIILHLSGIIIIIYLFLWGKIPVRATAPRGGFFAFRRFWLKITKDVHNSFEHMGRKKKNVVPSTWLWCRSGLVQSCYEGAIRLTIQLLGAWSDKLGLLTME